ncbi:MAG: hypothetical protein PHW41_07075, partial [Eubacteriales bacterium]|nr:hypothetical protein [Eubacteriales bacterium]
AKDHKQVFVAELKKPNADIVLRNADQLVSYMLQLRLRFGLLIGDTLQVYYDVPGDNEKPVKVIEIPFTPDNKNGDELISVLMKDAYSDTSFASWCIKRIEEEVTAKEVSRLVELLTSNEGNALLLGVLKKHLNTRFSEEVIENVIENIQIRVEVKKQNSTKLTKVNMELPKTHINNGDILNIELKPAQQSDFKKLILQKKRANIITYYADGRVEKRIWEADKLSESSNILGNLRSRPEFRNGEWQKRGIIKVVCAIED